MPNKKLQILNTLLDQVSTKADMEQFVKIFSQILELFKKMKAANEQEMVNLKAAFEQKVSELNKLSSTNSSKIDGKVDNLKKEALAFVKSEISFLIREQENALNFLRDKARTIKDGKDADEEVIVGKVLAKIPPPKEQTATEIRDKMETLQGDERYKVFIDDVEDLRKTLDELKSRPLGKGGGGFSYLAMTQHIIDDETPSGTKNGVNKEFTTALTPNPSTSLKVYRGGARQRITEDYTLSGNTITFTIAPAADEILLVDYRV